MLVSMNIENEQEKTMSRNIIETCISRKKGGGNKRQFYKHSNGQFTNFKGILDDVVKNANLSEFMNYHPFTMNLLNHTLNEITEDELKNSWALFEAKVLMAGAYNAKTGVLILQASADAQWAVNLGHYDLNLDDIIDVSCQLKALSLDGKVEASISTENGFNANAEFSANAHLLKGDAQIKLPKITLLGIQLTLAADLSAGLGAGGKIGGGVDLTKRGSLRLYTMLGGYFGPGAEVLGHCDIALTPEFEQNIQYALQQSKENTQLILNSPMYADAMSTLNERRQQAKGDVMKLSIIDDIEMTLLDNAASASANATLFNLIYGGISGLITSEEVASENNSKPYQQPSKPAEKTRSQSPARLFNQPNANQNSSQSSQRKTASLKTISPMSDLRHFADKVNIRDMQAVKTMLDAKINADKMNVDIVNDISSGKSIALRIRQQGGSSHYDIQMDILEVAVTWLMNKLFGWLDSSVRKDKNDVKRLKSDIKDIQNRWNTLSEKANQLTEKQIDLTLDEYKQILEDLIQQCTDTAAATDKAWMYVKKSRNAEQSLKEAYQNQNKVLYDYRAKLRSELSKVNHRQQTVAIEIEYQRELIDLSQRCVSESDTLEGLIGQLNELNASGGLNADNMLILSNQIQASCTTILETVHAMSHRRNNSVDPQFKQSVTEVMNQFRKYAFSRQNVKEEVLKAREPLDVGGEVAPKVQS